MVQNEASSKANSLVMRLFVAFPVMMCSSPVTCIELWLSMRSGDCLLLRGEHKIRASDVAKMS